MSNVLFRMFAHKMHLLVQGLYALHICSCVVGKFDFLTSAHPFRTPVEIAHIYGTTYFAGDGVEACLPPLDRFAGTFWSQCKMYDVLFLHLSDDAKDDVASFFTVYRNTTEFSEKPSQRSPEKFSFDHAVRLAAD